MFWSLHGCLQNFAVRGEGKAVDLVIRKMNDAVNTELLTEEKMYVIYYNWLDSLLNMLVPKSPSYILNN